MVIDGDKITDCTRSFDETLWLHNCRLERATIIVKGDIHVDSCEISFSDLEATGDVILNNQAEVNGAVSANFISASCPISFLSTVYAKQILIGGESSFTTLRAEEAKLYGSCFGQYIDVRNIIIDGDLVSDALVAGNVVVTRGALLVKDLCVGKAKAEIIGNYSEERLDTSRLDFTWTRPMVYHAEPGSLLMKNMRANALLVIDHYAGHLPEIRELYGEIDQIEACGDVSNVFPRLFEILKSNYDKLKPNVQQFVDCVDKHGFPGLLWRF